jgi:hypothetical protein
MGPPNREHQLLQDALAALQEVVDLKAKVLPFPKTKPRLQADALVEVNFNAHKQLFVAEIKTIDRRIAVGQIKAHLENLIDQQYGGYQPLLVTGFATPDLAEECRKLDLPFLDTAGNLYLHTKNFLVDVRGKARPDRPFKNEYRAYNPAGLKIIFALLCRPELAGARYREIAKFAQVALGAIGPVLNDLAQRAYLQKGKTPTGTLVKKKELLHEWVTYYPANLRPTLNPRRYQADRAQLTQTDLGQFRAYWGGEYGAEQLTRYLKAERFTIYVPGAPPPALMTKTRMRLAAEGNTEILEAFWHPELVQNPTTIAPPLLIYADLMATADPRNLEAAKEVYDRFLEPLVHQQ